MNLDSLREGRRVEEERRSPPYDDDARGCSGSTRESPERETEREMRERGGERGWVSQSRLHHLGLIHSQAHRASASHRARGHAASAGVSTAA
jgi:hypothetical protein